MFRVSYLVFHKNLLDTFCNAVTNHHYRIMEVFLYQGIFIHPWQNKGFIHAKSVQTWELAQKLRKTPKRIDTLGEANPLTDLLYYADCGEKMYNHRSKGDTENNPYPSDFFYCSSYTLAC